MALLVCCPCGNPLDCEHLEVVVTLTCPTCSRELTLEVESAENRRYFAVLTVMDGPYWVGEQFVMPVGEELYLGKAAKNWLSLESEALADKHCKLHLSSNGRIDVEGLSEEKGTWIGEVCVAKGRLNAQESLTIGEYRFRLDFRDAIAGAMVTRETDAEMAGSGVLPELTSVAGGKTLAGWLVSNRFLLSRWFLVIFAWFVSIDHACTLRTRGGWAWYWAVIAGVAILVTLLVSAQWLSLARRHLRYVSLAFLVLLAMLDVAAWQMPMSAVTALILASALVLLVARLPSPFLAVFADLLSVIAVLMTVIFAVQSVLNVIPS